MGSPVFFFFSSSFFKKGPCWHLPGGPVVSSELSLRRAWVQSLVGELGSHRSQGAARKKSGGPCCFVLKRIILCLKMSCVFQPRVPELYSLLQSLGPTTCFLKALVTVCACIGARGGEPTAKLEQHRVGVSAWLCLGTRNTPWIFSRAFFSLLLSVSVLNYLFIFGCPESSLLCGLSSTFGMISGAMFSSGGVRASHCGTWTRQLQLRALEHRLSSCDTRAYELRSTWDLFRSGIPTCISCIGR